METEGTQEGCRQPTGLVHGSGQREQIFWRKEGSLRCGAPHTDLCVNPEQPLELFHLLVFHWWIMNPQLSLHRGPCAVLLTGPGVAARDSLAAQASRWWHRASYFLSLILLLLPFSIAADNSSILSLRLITQSKDSSLLYIPTWLWTSFCSFLTLS